MKILSSVLLTSLLLFSTQKINAQGATCATALAITPGTYTADGPSSGNGASNLCFGGGATHADWYSYTPTADGTIDISACNGGADTRLSVHTGSCGSLTCLTSNDDACDLGNGGLYASELTNISVTAGTTYYIEWDDNWSSSGFTWTLSYTPPPACPAPANQTATNITATSADLDWSQSGSPGSWDIEWGPSGFTQGSGTLISGISSHPYILNGLSANTSYDWYVRADCSNSGNGQSTWTGPHTFTTACATATNVPYSTDFASNPPCWTVQDVNADGLTWAWNGGTYSGCDNGPGDFDISPTGNTSFDDWLFSPEFTLNGGSEYFIAFNVGPTTAPTTTPTLRVYAMDAPDPTTANKILLFEGSDLDYFIQLPYNFCSPANSTFTAPSGWSAYYIGFYCSGMASSGPVIDDFSIKSAPAPSSMVINNTNEGYCIEYILQGVAGNGWHHIYDSNNPTEVVLSINSNGQVLDYVKLTKEDYTYTQTLTDANTGNSKKLMSRIFELKSLNAPSAPVSIRLYQTDQELTDMNNSSAGSGMSNFAASDLDVTHYFSNTNQSCTVTDNTPDGNITEKIDNAAITANTTVSNGFYLEFQINPLIEFFAHEPSVGPLSTNTFPLTLISFKAFARDEYNQILWSTATEDNLRFINVERSSNGQPPWQSIAQLPGRNTPYTQQYEVKDENPLPLSYYRLRFTDWDGSEVITSTKFVRREDLPKGQIQIYPNPAGETLFIDITAAQPEQTVLKLYATTGELLQSRETELQEGNNLLKWDLSALPSGIYLLKAESRSWSQTLRFLK